MLKSGSNPGVDAGASRNTNISTPKHKAEHGGILEALKRNRHVISVTRAAAQGPKLDVDMNTIQGNPAIHAARGIEAVLPTDEAAAALNRRPQTLRKWACLENGPIRPVRINGRLAWRVSDLQKLLSGEAA